MGRGALTCYGCSDEQCSTPRARCVWCCGGMGGWGGAGQLQTLQLFSRRMSNVMVALMNYVAHHARDVFGVGVGWGGGGVGRDNCKRCSCFQEECQTL